MHSNDTIEKIELNKQINDQAVLLIEKYGVDTQANIVCEELSELLVALFHYSRGKITKKELISEIADCEMQLTVLKYLTCETSEEYILVLKEKVEKQKEFL